MLGKTKENKVVRVLDSGCSRHITGDMALLSQFEEKVGPLVTFGDDNFGIIMGYDNMKVKNVIIENVSLISGVKHNILSISQFIDRGFKVVCDED